ncbi:hypothetical protein XdyCFBP7245_02680 [Xanthomonas dyei]|uniref:Uncharacterized protein n=1 Tax=Xanthomonas dyei TaxID=743699 RepID=A0A2S7CA48_9XANT|nr:hypothetical protein XdyCFBP7245_02680 [Xanthomonas dyei]
MTAAALFGDGYTASRTRQQVGEPGEKTMARARSATELGVFAIAVRRSCAMTSSHLLRNG